MNQNNLVQIGKNYWDLETCRKSFKKPCFFEKINTSPRVLLSPQIFDYMFLKANENFQVQIQTQLQVLML